MTNYAILRVAKVKAGGLQKLAQHHNREKQPPNADPNAPKPRLPYPATSAEVTARVKEAIAQHNKTGRKLQKNSPVALDIFVGFSKSQGKELDNQYFSRALEWIENRYGEENVLLAAIHEDETTPHMQVLVMPRINGRFQASKVLGNRKDFQAMQDDFHKACGEPVGLKRGLRGSDARHIKIKQFYAAMDSSLNIPDPVKVPPLPGWLDRVLAPQEAKKLAERRAAAIEHNKRRYELIKRAAAVAGKVHPEVIRRQAERYRQIREESEIAKDRLRCANDVLAAAEETRRLNERIARDMQQPARLIAKALKLLDQNAVDKIAQAIPGVELVAGKDLIDQLRRQNRCRNLEEGLDLIKTAIDAAQPSTERDTILKVFDAPH